MSTITDDPEVQALLERVCAVVEGPDWHPRRKASLRALLKATVVRVRSVCSAQSAQPDCREAAEEAFLVASGLAAMADPVLAATPNGLESAQRMQHMVVEMINAMAKSAGRKDAA